MLISTKMYKLPRFGKRAQTSVVQYRVWRSSAKHETVARGIKIECEARDLSSRRFILGSGESAPLSISSERKLKRPSATQPSASSPSRHAVSLPWDIEVECEERDLSSRLKETIGNIGGFYSHVSYEIPANTAQKYVVHMDEKQARLYIQSHKYKIVSCAPILMSNS